jgi:hypothetical protein
MTKSAQEVTISKGAHFFEKLLVSQLIKKCKDTTIKITNKVHYID